MGTLAIRQGDVLYFARSLVWRQAIMSSGDVLSMSEPERFERFLKTWNELKATGNFVVSQKEADRIAAMYGVKAPVVKESDEDAVPIGGSTDGPRGFDDPYSAHRRRLSGRRS